MKAGPELHKNGPGTFRSIRARYLRKIEVEMEESPVPLLHRKKVSKNGKNAPNDKDNEENWTKHEENI